MVPRHKRGVVVFVHDQRCRRFMSDWDIGCALTCRSDFSQVCARLISVTVVLVDHLSGSRGLDFIDTSSEWLSDVVGG